MSRWVSGVNYVIGRQCYPCWEPCQYLQLQKFNWMGNCSTHIKFLGINLDRALGSHWWINKSKWNSCKINTCFLNNFKYLLCNLLLSFNRWFSYGVRHGAPHTWRRKLENFFLSCILKRLKLNDKKKPLKCKHLIIIWMKYMQWNMLYQNKSM